MMKREVIFKQFVILLAAIGSFIISYYTLVPRFASQTYVAIIYATILSVGFAGGLHFLLKSIEAFMCWHLLNNTTKAIEIVQFVVAFGIAAVCFTINVKQTNILQFMNRQTEHVEAAIDHPLYLSMKERLLRLNDRRAELVQDIRKNQQIADKSLADVRRMVAENNWQGNNTAKAASGATGAIESQSQNLMKLDNDITFTENRMVYLADSLAKVQSVQFASIDTEIAGTIEGASFAFIVFMWIALLKTKGSPSYRIIRIPDKASDDDSELNQKQPSESLLSTVTSRFSNWAHDIAKSNKSDLDKSQGETDDDFNQFDKNTDDPRDLKMNIQAQTWDERKKRAVAWIKVLFLTGRDYNGMHTDAGKLLHGYDSQFDPSTAKGSARDRTRLKQRLKQNTWNEICLKNGKPSWRDMLESMDQEQKQRELIENLEILGVKVTGLDVK